MLAKGASNSEALLNAVANGQTDAVKALLENGANPNIFSSKDKDSPLLMAVRSNNREIFDLLVSHGADLEQQNANGDFPLYAAYRNQNLDMFSSLIDKGANLDKPINEHNDTLLTMSIYEGHLSTSEMLVNNGADVNHKTNYGDTPLILAADQRGDTPELNKKLAGLIGSMIEKGADMEQTNRWGMNAMDYAVRQDNKELMATLSRAKSETGQKLEVSTLKETLTFLQQDIINLDTLNKDVVGQNKSPKDMAVMKDYGEPESAPNIPSQYSLTDKASNSNISITINAMKRGR